MINAQHRAVELIPGTCFTYGSSAIRWRVVAVYAEKQTMLVIADQAICERGFYGENEFHFGWNHSSLRKWLNGEFLKQTFTPNEREGILTVSLENIDDRDRKYSTKDKVFLLSLEEIEATFSGDEERSSDRAWWLRSSGVDGDHIVQVCSDGSINNQGGMGTEMCGIRPAILLDLCQGFVRSQIRFVSEASSGENAFDRAILADGSVLEMTERYVDLVPGVHVSAGSENWRVLDVDTDKGAVLMITDRSIAKKAYHQKEGVNERDAYYPKKKAMTWADCSLRQWLNQEYLQQTFTPEEQAGILTVHLTNPGNPAYKTRGGADTEDKVFLLSIEEAERYFSGDEDRATGDPWWLRSPGQKDYYEDYAANILRSGGYDYAIGRSRSGGGINLAGTEVQNDINTVRPAMWVSLDSMILSRWVKEINGEWKIREYREAEYFLS